MDGTMRCPCMTLEHGFSALPSKVGRDDCAGSQQCAGIHEEVVFRGECCL